MFLSLVNNAQESWTHTLRLPAQGRVDAIGARGCQALVRTSRSVLSTCLAAVVCGLAGGAMDVVGQANLVALCILFLHTFVSACGHGQNRPASPYSQRMRICSISAVVPLVIGAFAVVLRAKKKNLLNCLRLASVCLIFTVAVCIAGLNCLEKVE